MSEARGAGRWWFTALVVLGWVAVVGTLVVAVGMAAGLLADW